MVLNDLVHANDLCLRKVNFFLLNQRVDVLRIRRFLSFANLVLPFDNLRQVLYVLACPHCSQLMEFIKMVSNSLRANCGLEA